MKRFTRLTAALAVGSALILACLPHVSAEEPGKTESKPSSGLSRKDALALIEESAAVLTKGQQILRFASVKIPNLVTDNLKFRRLDRELENCRAETYPALDAAERLKSRPQNLRELVRLYVGLRLLEERLMPLSEHLAGVGNPSANPLSVQIVDLANKVARVALRLHPYVYRVVDAYQSQASDVKVDINLGWAGDESEVQGPGL
ncbi:MAG TPA: hypothetical protein V6D08_18065 [Candidatus Obscuribacterales bacterium]